jgi:hypothetical protein
LKENTGYYAQVQGQLAITDRQYCDFYIHTSYASFCERIYFNAEYWSKIVCNLQYFFENHIAKHLLGGTHIEDLPEPMDVDENEGGVYFCNICHHVVKESENISSFREGSIACDSCDNWYHFKCAKVSKSALKSAEAWMCQFCK